jgi:hypothetical protein
MAPPMATIPAVMPDPGCPGCPGCQPAGGAGVAGDLVVAACDINGADPTAAGRPAYTPAAHGDAIHPANITHVAALHTSGTAFRRNVRSCSHFRDGVASSPSSSPCG